MEDYTYSYGILQGGTGSVGNIQWTDGNLEGGTKYTILDSSRNLQQLTSVSASGDVQGNAGEFETAKVKDLTSGSIVLAGTNGELQDSTNLTFDGSDLTVGGDVSAANGSFSGGLTITGDLTVNGSTTTVNTTNLDVKDNMILLNDGIATGSNANDSGILIERGSTGDNAFMGWDESADKFILGTTTASSDATGNLGINAATLVVNTLEGDVTGDVTGQVSDISNHSTDDLSEGTGSLYYTDARARGAVSATDAGGDGSFSYNSSTGAFTYTGPSASETRAHFSAADFITLTDGEISVDTTEFTSSARSVVSVTDAGGDGSLAYNSSTGVITYTGPSASEVRAHFSGAAGIDLTDGAVAVNVDNNGIEINADTLRLASGAMAGTTDEVEVSYVNGAFTIGLPDDVTVSGTLQADGQLYVGSILTVEGGNFSTSEPADFSSTLNVAGNATFEAAAEIQGNATITGSLAFDAGASVDRILDEDDMSSDSASALATQQSIKAYVDAQLTAQSLEFQGDEGAGSLAIDLDSETLSIVGTSNEIETAGSGNQIQIGLPDDVTIGQDLTVTRNLAVNGNVDLGSDSSDSISANGLFDSHLLPDGATRNIGGSGANQRWGDVYATNVYTGDFHMKNERGDWTLFEESDHIRIRNNATGQEFKLDMTPVAE